MKNRRLALVVGLVVMCTVMVSLYAIADCGKPGCGAGGVKAGAGCCGMNAPMSGCAMKSGRVMAPAASRGYSGGIIKLSVCPMGMMTLAVLEQGNRPDANSSLTAMLVTAEGSSRVDFKQVKPGMWRTNPGSAAAGKLNVIVSGGGGMSDSVTFDVAAPRGGRGMGCGMMSGAGCACTATAGGCSKMGQGGCATMGACKQRGAMSAACKCETCKCSPCKCK